MRHSNPSTLLLICALACFTHSAMNAYAHAPLSEDVARHSEHLIDHPDDAPVLLERARLQRLDGNAEHALHDLDHALTLAPEDRRLRFERALTLADLHQDVEAISILDGLIRESEGGAGALILRARLHSRMGRDVVALLDLDRALEIDKSLTTYLTRGKILERLDQVDRAAAGYRDAAASLGDAPILLRALARVETRRGNYDAALDAIDRGAKRASVKTLWYLDRADVLELASRHVDAREMRIRALAAADKALAVRATPLNHTARARALLAADRCTEALLHARLAHDRAPSLALTRDTLQRAKDCGSPVSAATAP